MQWQDPNTLKVGTEGYQMNATVQKYQGGAYKKKP